MSRSLGTWFFAAAVLGGCEPLDDTLDGGPTDGSPADAEAGDARPADATSPDATPPDAEPADAAPADAAPPDAVPADAAPQDAGPDAEPPCPDHAVNPHCLSPGDGDPDFGDPEGPVPGFVVPGFAPEDELAAVALLPDGRVVVAGTARRADHDLLVARFDADGALDATFGGDGWTAHDAGGTDRAYGLALDPATGAVTLAGHVGHLGGVVAGLARFDAEGRLDAAFGAGGVRAEPELRAGTFRGVARLDDGRLLTGGEARDDQGRFARVVARYGAGGQPDVDFGLGGVAFAPAAAPHHTGGVALTGAGAFLSGYAERGAADAAAVAAFDEDGALAADALHEAPAAAGDRLTAIAPHPAGGLVAVGERVGPDGRDMLVLRLDDAGALDGTFGDGGRATVDFAGDTDTAYAVAVDEAGRIIVAGRARIDGVDRAAAVRLLPDGTPDAELGPEGQRTWTLDPARDAAITAVALAPDRRLVVVGRVATEAGRNGFVGRIYR